MCFYIDKIICMESVMFPKVVESKGKQYLYFVESYRNEKGTPAHRNIAALGCCYLLRYTDRLFLQ